MDDLANILSRIFDFVTANPFIVIIVFGLLASARRNRRNQSTRMPLPEPKPQTRAQSKQQAQTLFPAPTQGDVVITPTSITTVTPPPVEPDRPDDLMKDLVKRVG